MTGLGPPVPPDPQLGAADIRRLFDRLSSHLSDAGSAGHHLMIAGGAGRGWPAPSSPNNDTVTIDAPDYIYVSGPGETTTNNVTVTVLDQYGGPFTAATVALASNVTGVNVTPGVGPVDSNGSREFSYDYPGPGRRSETLTATSAGVSKTKKVHWAADAASSGTNKAVLAGNVHRNHIVVDESSDRPVLVAYDSNDRFNLNGAPASLAEFEEELAEALERGGP